MTILVCGSRTWTDRDGIRRVLEEYRLTAPHILHGAARGADTTAAEAALSFGYRVHAYPAQWDQYGKSAGCRRNIQMLDVPFHHHAALHVIFVGVAGYVLTLLHNDMI